MSFTSSIKAVGSKAVSLAKDAEKGLPFIVGLINAYATEKSGTSVGNDLNKLGSLIASTEAVGAVIGSSATGAAKFDAALPVAEQIIEASLVNGKKVVDKAKFEAACKSILQGVYDVLDSVEDTPASTTTAAPTPAA